MLAIQKFGKHGECEELTHLSSNSNTGRTTRRLVNVLVRLLNIFARMISKMTDMLKVIMNTEMSRNTASQSTKYEEVEISFKEHI